MRGKKAVVLVVLLVCGLVTAAGCAGGSDEAKNGAVSGESVATPVAAVPVSTIVLESANFTDSFEVVGQTEPMEIMRAASETPGLIVSAPFAEGDTVKRGQVLYRIDTKMDNAQIAVLNNQILTARREAERLEILKKDGLATAQQVDQARSTLDAAQLNLRQIEVGKAKGTVTSPVSGYVTQKNADQGEYASPGTPLATIVVYDTIVVHALVPESQIRHVKKGQEFEIEIPALGRSFKGTVHRVGILAKSPSLTYPVEVRIANPDLAILPGMRTVMKIAREEFKDVIIVPREAILEGYNSREAMVATSGSDGKTKAELRKVELGPGTGASVVITDGLKVGDRLITQGHRGLVAGSAVEVIQKAAAQ